MRSIAAALVGIALAAGASYAHTNRTDASGQVAGTLTCVTKPELSLVFGRSPVADCSFVAERGGVRQDYRALLPAGPAADVGAVQRIVWRVLTRDEVIRPAMLGGAFRSVLTDADRPRLAGRSADLELVSHSRRSIASFAHGHTRIDLAAVEDGIDG